MVRGIKITVKGDKELEAKLKKKADLGPIRNVVSKYGAVLSDTMKDDMDKAYVKGYSVPHTKNTVFVQKSDGGMTASVGPTTYYAPYVEYGTRKMSAEPAVRPAFNTVKPKFIADLKKEVNK